MCALASALSREFGSGRQWWHRSGVVANGPSAALMLVGLAACCQHCGARTCVGCVRSLMSVFPCPALWCCHVPMSLHPCRHVRRVSACPCPSVPCLRVAVSLSPCSVSPCLHASVSVSTFTASMCACACMLACVRACVRLREVVAVVRVHVRLCACLHECASCAVHSKVLSLEARASVIGLFAGDGRCCRSNRVPD